MGTVSPPRGSGRLIYQLPRPCLRTELSRRDGKSTGGTYGCVTRCSPWLLRNSGAPNGSARTGGPVTRRNIFACLTASAAAAACALTALPGSANAEAPAPVPASKHVLLISVDGMHQSDLDWNVAHHPSSTLAKLTRTGSEY